MRTTLREAFRLTGVKDGNQAVRIRYASEGEDKLRTMSASDADKIFGLDKAKVDTIAPHFAPLGGDAGAYFVGFKYILAV